MTARAERRRPVGTSGGLPPALLAQLSAVGIAAEFEDAFGEPRHLGVDAAEQLVRAAGLEPATGTSPLPTGQLDDPRGADASAAVVVTRPGRTDEVSRGELVLEDQTSRGVVEQLPPDLPLGYHELHRADGATTSVIVSPGRCFAHPQGVWGWAVQLYSVLSAGSWGVGDLADLRELGAWSSGVGASTMLVNPLDAVVATEQRPESPYYPSSRRFRDPLYLRIEEVEGAGLIGDELAALAEAARRPTRRIERDAIVATKLDALERIFAVAPGAGHEPAFLRFREEQGDALERFAIFEMLTERHGGGWSSWPDELHDPYGPAVAEQAARHEGRVRFHAWIQWLLDEQLRAAGQTCGLMRDLPIGFAPDGADAWVWQDLLATGVTVGAPPDELGPAGQDWQVPAFVPAKLRAAAYRPVVETFRSAFRHAAALRIDHALGLFRLFWVPPGGPTAGSYVRQDTDALLDILALESHRAGAYVVAEDLGTVGPGVRDELVGRGALRYRVLWFEDEPPEDWDASGLGSLTTHDLPSVGSLWTRAELDVQRALGDEVDEERIEAMRTDLAGHTGVDPDATVEEVCVAAAEVIAGAGCDVVVVQLEDAVGATHRINVPGTDQQRRPDNWSLPLPVAREDLTDHPTVTRVVTALREGRERRQAGDGGQTSW